MKTKTFQNGDLVWVYNGNTEPREGVVTQTRDYGWFVKDYLGEFLHAEGSIYARPGDGEYLAGVIEDDAQHMNLCAKRFRSALPNPMMSREDRRTEPRQHDQ